MKTLLSLSICILATLLAPQSVLASIDVDFESTPLFGVSNFLPGDTAIKTVTVTNTGTETEDVYTELLNVVDGGLSEMVDVSISAGGTLFSGSFDDLDSAGKVPLTSLGAGDSVTYSYAMSFESQAGNPFQNKTLGFDLCIGFSGGQFECDDAPSGYAQGSYNGYSQGSYNGGYAQGSYGGGNGERISLGEGGGSPEEPEGPVPQIAGESTSIWPLGAPNTGFGILLQDEAVRVKFFAVLLILMIIGGLVYTRKKLEVW